MSLHWTPPDGYTVHDTEEDDMTGHGYTVLGAIIMAVAIVAMVVAPAVTRMMDVAVVLQTATG